MQQPPIYWGFLLCLCWQPLFLKQPGLVRLPETEQGEIKAVMIGFYMKYGHSMRRGWQWLWPVGVLLLSSWAVAEPGLPPKPAEYLAVPDPLKPQSMPVAPHVTSGAAPSEAVELSEAQLLQNPELMQRVLDSSLLLNDLEAVKIVLPIYRKLPPEQQDPILLRFAQAALARMDGRTTEAIRLYREIIAMQPQLTPVRLQLATALFEQHENEAARDQLRKLRAENLPEPIAQTVDQYIQALNQRDEWSLNAGITYLHENNINNAPKQRTVAVGQGELSLPEPVNARGLGYNFGVAKNWSWQDGWSGRLKVEANGKH